VKGASVMGASAMGAPEKVASATAVSVTGSPVPVELSTDDFGAHPESGALAAPRQVVVQTQII